MDRARSQERAHRGGSALRRAGSAPLATLLLTVMSSVGSICGCSSDDTPPSPPVDKTPPGAIVGFAVTRTGAGYADLAWRAPSEDGDEGGAATAYSLRYRLGGLDEGTLAESEEADGLPAPGAPGTEQTWRLRGLRPDTLYGTVLFAIDDAGLVSPPSDFVLARTRSDTLPPEAIDDLTLAAGDTASASLAWTAPHGDGGTGPSVAEYDLRYATQPLDAGIWDASPRAGGLPVPAEPGAREGFVLTGLAAHTTYWIAIRSADRSGNRSALSNQVRVSTSPPDLVPPAAVTDLIVVDSTAASLTIRFTLTGDDGWDGPVHEVDLRVRAGGLDPSTWSAASPVVPSPPPGPPGTAREHQIAGLLPETLYGIGVLLRDEAGNASEPVAIVHASTLGRPGQFVAPRGLDADPVQRGAYVVADSAAGVVYRGGMLGPPVAIARIEGVVGVRRSGTGWVAISVDETLASGSLWTFSSSSQDPVRRAEGLGIPADIDVAAGGDVIVLERSGGRVLRFDPVTWQQTALLLPDLALGAGVAVAPSGDICFGGISAQDGQPMIGVRSAGGSISVLHRPLDVRDLARAPGGSELWYLDAHREALVAIPFAGGDPDTLATGLRRAAAIAPTSEGDPLGPGVYYSARDGRVERVGIRP